MKPYEALFIFPPEGTPEVRKAQATQLEELIKRFNGSLLQKTELGKRPLGYEVRKFREGFFVSVEFQVDPLKMQEFRKALELQPEVIKYMILVKKKQSEKKSAPKPSSTPAPVSKSARPSSNVSPASHVDGNMGQAVTSH